eukprot:CAMPEP_0168343340 /NCGR_PEP_ID=MMETSP0213-20121227/16019_1 /TAXON_ID=151035 /ORGANISM="Euplotes harpa, Strain FSP1.4" /LENGTH=175 /DNA_ID=CAMNT_0008350585 /DNA_START=1309 /DNA_END=1836 /DNA_ORIENTATION=+
MAPEVVVASDKGHNYEVDWWALGILMYELYYTKTPFLGNTREEILYNIKHNEVEFPNDIKRESEKSLKSFISVITKLLAKDPEERLGHSSTNQGAKKVKKHPFFRNIAWDKILERNYEAPYVPSIDIDKIQQYLQGKGCKIGRIRKKGDKYGKLAETDLPPKVKQAVKYLNKKFN